MHRLPDVAGDGVPAPGSTDRFPWRGMVAAFGAFATLAALVALGPLPALERVDLALSQAVRSAPMPAADTIALAATLFGDFPLTVTMMTLLGALLLLAGRRALALHAAWLFLLTKLAVATTKITLGRARPLALFEGGDAYAFPSGHVTSAAVLLGVVGALTVACGARRRTRVATLGVLVLAALLVGYSRLRLGAHWPSDVLGGLALATGLTLPFAWHARRSAPPPHLAPLALATLAIGYGLYATIAWQTEAARYSLPVAASSPRIAMMPATGPMARIQNSAGQPTAAATNGVACTVAMLSAKPSAVCSAMRLPASSGGEKSATSAENCAESGMTVAPQTTTTIATSHTGPPNTRPASTAEVALAAMTPTVSRALPIRSASLPAGGQSSAPAPMATKAVSLARLAARAGSTCRA